jgi:type II secretory pathway pseudopilin PulG
MRRATHAFTLLEIMLAVIVGVMVLSLAVPSISGLMEEKRVRASFDAFDAIVAEALNRSITDHRAQRIVWDKEKIVLLGGEDAGKAENPRELPIGEDEDYRVEFPAALVKNPRPEWTIWPTGTCEPVIVHYHGPRGDWRAEYDPLTVRPAFSTNAKS